MNSIKYNKFTWSSLFNPVTKTHSNWLKLIRHHNFMMLYFPSKQLGHSTNTIILKSSQHKLYAWVFVVICTFQSSQFFDRLSMHFGVVDIFLATALTTADRRRPPSFLLPSLYSFLHCLEYHYFCSVVYYWETVL
jgi:hypothetical protein